MNQTEQYKIDFKFIMSNKTCVNQKHKQCLFPFVLKIQIDTIFPNSYFVCIKIQNFLPNLNGPNGNIILI